jgi:hypothetical protein
MREPEPMLEESTGSSITRAETFTPRVDGVVDKAIFQTRRQSEALQIVKVLDLQLINYVLHNVPDLVVDRIMIMVVRWPQI